MKTKQVFNERIDMFIESFAERFKDIEGAELMQDKDKTPTSFSGESKKIQKTVEEMRVMHSEISNIFAKIANAQAEKKIRYIDLSKAYMNEIKNEIAKKSNFIRDTVKKLNESLENTIP
jgi:peptidoglycan hydrolase CwlO-like protein